MLQMEDNPQVVRPLDGISVLPLFEGTMERRETPIVFRYKNGAAVTNDDFVFFTNILKGSSNKAGWETPPAGSKNDRLFLPDDLREKNNVASQHPELVAKWKELIFEFGESVQ